MKSSQALLAELKACESPNITYFDERFPVVIKKGRGMCVVDIEGKSYLDFTAFFGVQALGHCNEKIKKALRKQSEQLIAGIGDVHPNESKIHLLSALKKILPYESPNIVLGCSGSEAVEVAMKTAVLATGKNRFLSFADAYHGLLSAPLKLSDNRIYTDSFESWIRPRATVLPFPAEGSVDAVLSQLEDEMKTLKYSAVVLEPVQGRGGDRAFPNDFLREASALSKKYGVLLIFDEIFSGLGRTGKMFAFEHSGVVPDIICLGKALGGGLPLSACAGDVLEVWGQQVDGEARHTSTFLGHPLACATGVAAVKEIMKRLPEFQESLVQIDREFDKLSLPFKFKTTGKGFMRGINFPGRRGFGAYLMFELLKEGFLVIPAGGRGEVLSLTPPLIAQARDFKKLFAVLKALVGEAASQSD